MGQGQFHGIIYIYNILEDVIFLSFLVINRTFTATYRAFIVSYHAFEP